jgi:hypothetical protein
MNDPSQTAPRGRSFVATALIVFGIVWMALTGLCTASVLVSSLIGNLSWEWFASLPVLAIIGVICIGPGWLIWTAGKALKRRRNGADR